MATHLGFMKPPTAESKDESDDQTSFDQQFRLPIYPSSNNNSKRSRAQPVHLTNSAKTKSKASVVSGDRDREQHHNQIQSMKYAQQRQQSSSYTQSSYHSPSNSQTTNITMTTATTATTAQDPLGKYHNSSKQQQQQQQQRTHNHDDDLYVDYHQQTHHQQQQLQPHASHHHSTQHSASFSQSNQTPLTPDQWNYSEQQPPSTAAAAAADDIAPLIAAFKNNTQLQQQQQQQQREELPLQAPAFGAMQSSETQMTSITRLTSVAANSPLELDHVHDSASGDAEEEEEEDDYHDDSDHISDDDVLSDEDDEDDEEDEETITRPVLTPTKTNNTISTIQPQQMSAHEYKPSITNSFDAGNFDHVVNPPEELRSYLGAIPDPVKQAAQASQESASARSPHAHVQQSHDSDDDVLHMSPNAQPQAPPHRDRLNKNIVIERDPFDTEPEESELEYNTTHLQHDAAVAMNGNDGMHGHVSEYDQLVFTIANSNVKSTKSAKSKSHSHSNVSKTPSRKKSARNSNNSRNNNNSYKRTHNMHDGDDDDEEHAEPDESDESENKTRSRERDSNHTKQSKVSKNAKRVVTPVPHSRLHTKKQQQQQPQQQPQQQQPMNSNRFHRVSIDEYDRERKQSDSTTAVRGRADTVQSQTSTLFPPLHPALLLHKSLSPSQSNTTHTEMSIIDNEDNMEYHTMSDGAGLKRISQSYVLPPAMKHSPDRSPVPVILEEEDEDDVMFENERDVQSSSSPQSAVHTNLNQKHENKNAKNDKNNLLTSTHLHIHNANLHQLQDDVVGTAAAAAASAEHHVLLDSPHSASMLDRHRAASMVVEYDESVKEETIVHEYASAVAAGTATATQPNPRNAFYNGGGRPYAMIVPPPQQQLQKRKNGATHARQQIRDRQEEEVPLRMQLGAIESEQMVLVEQNERGVLSPSKSHQSAPDKYPRFGNTKNTVLSFSGGRGEDKNYTKYALRLSDTDEERDKLSGSHRKSDFLDGPYYPNNKWTKWIILAALTICFILGVCMGFGISWIFFVSH